MITIIEGLDAQGKSFLAKDLAKYYKAELIHVSAPKTKNAFLEYVQLLNNLDINKNYVFDRCFHGECAYGPVYRGKSTVSDEQQHYLEMLIMKHKPVVVYCWTNIENTKKVFNTRGEEFTKIKDVVKLNNMFKRTFKKSILPVHHHSWLTESKNSLIHEISLKRMVHGNYSVSKNDPEFIGHLNPDFLLVGDKKNKNLAHLPVFCSTSGMFLIKSLDVVRHRHMILNSNSISLSFIKKQKPIWIIALGRNAERCLSKLKVNFVSIVHPQYAKRFYGKDSAKIYKSQLKEAFK